MESTVTALEMRKKFGGILDRVVKKGDHVTIMRGNVALAVLIPVKEHQSQCLDRDRPRRVEEFFSEIAAWKKKHPAAARRMAKEDSVKIIRKMREKRWSSSTRQ